MKSNIIDNYFLLLNSSLITFLILFSGAEMIIPIITGIVISYLVSKYMKNIKYMFDNLLMIYLSILLIIKLLMN